MSAIFADQPYRIILDVGQTMVGAVATQIAYEKPDGTAGVFAGTVSPPTTSTEVYHDVTAEENNAAGFWKFASYITFAGSTDPVRGKTVAKQILTAFTYELLNTLKSETFLNKTDTSDDEELSFMLQSIVEQAVDYCDVTTLDYDNATLTRAIAKQCAFEWRRKKDLGLSSIVYPDGTVSKFEVGEWLKEVRSVLDRQLTFTFGA